jgi:hypothetical protein
MDLHYRKNHNEIPNNSIDDDNNGYVDDYDGGMPRTTTAPSSLLRMEHMLQALPVLLETMDSMWPV